MSSYAVIHPDTPAYGTVLSLHGSREEAEAAIQAEFDARDRARRGRQGNAGHPEREISLAEQGEHRVRRGLAPDPHVRVYEDDEFGASFRL